MEVQERKSYRAFLIGADVASARSGFGVEDSLEELGLLADTAGLEVVGQTSQRLRHPDPATFIGSGKVEEVRFWLEELDVDVVIFDDELSPRHQRELEKAFGERIRVLDRTALILDIFAQHAHTREGALQVMLAQYNYRLPRLTRQWAHLARQVGGGVARGGSAGVGLRGPGETQLEVDRREIRRKIARLEADLAKVRAHRELYRAHRRRTGVPIVALVGYTNAGKSTLLNRLSGAHVRVADQLFATLDPTTRRIQLPRGGKVLVTDTVGFIQKLPHTLIAAFRSTLEEIREANLLLHVVDSSHPRAVQQIEVVHRTLKDELGIQNTPMLLVLNKIDLGIDEGERSGLALLQQQFPEAVSISALTGSGIEKLTLRVEQLLDSHLIQVVLRIPHSESGLVAHFHQLAAVREVKHTPDYVELTGLVDSHYLGDYEPYIVESAKQAGRQDGFV